MTLTDPVVRLYQDTRTIAGHVMVASFTATQPIQALVYVERPDGVVLLCWTAEYPSLSAIVRDAAVRIAQTTQGEPVSIHPPPVPIGENHDQDR